MKVNELLQKVIDTGGSDLHLTVGAPPAIRIDGKLFFQTDLEPLNSTHVEDLVKEVLNDEQVEALEKNREIDLSFAFSDEARFRTNVFHQRGYLAAVMRLIPLSVPTLDELNLPRSLYSFCSLPQGFVLVTGPAGQGKSTTMAALINYINETRQVHIISIEDPIEYVFPHKKSIVDQREINLDTKSWGVALRSVLREDPDVVMVGEMRDPETMAAAVTIAETGHLVFASIHTNSSSQSIDRIIDVFPEYQQQQIRVQLASILEGVISQRLIPALNGGRVPAVEIMLPTPAVRSVIREGKTHQLDNIISTSFEVGMVSLERSLADLVKSGKVEANVAKQHTVRPEDLMRYLRGI
ncbi:MAG: type IV pilus twitching motility protein PilT [Patescibacteria group bacterium]|nr:type IV pilus twitching motility protein PilT [Patescibacteria group bacterium]